MHISADTYLFRFAYLDLHLSECVCVYVWVCVYIHIFMDIYIKFTLLPLTAAVFSSNSQ